MKFNEKKATEVAYLFTRYEGGKINYMKLIKLMYILDRAALANWGRPVSTDTFVSMKHGPVLSNVLDLINHQLPEDEQSNWKTIMGETEGYEVSIKDEIDPEELSKAEIKLLESVYEKFGQFSQWRLRDIVHEFGEWRETESSIPIRYKDILKSLGKNKEDIERIVAEIEDIKTIDQFIGR